MAMTSCHQSRWPRLDPVKAVIRISGEPSCGGPERVSSFESWPILGNVYPFAVKLMSWRMLVGLFCSRTATSFRLLAVLVPDQQGRVPVDDSHWRPDTPTICAALLLLQSLRSTGTLLICSPSPKAMIAHRCMKLANPVCTIRWRRSSCGSS